MDLLSQDERAKVLKERAAKAKANRESRIAKMKPEEQKK